MFIAMRPLRILSWHVHGSYLFSLVQAPHEFYLPVKPGRPEGYGGRWGSFPWPANVHEVPAEEVRGLALDCVLFQSRKNYLHDQCEVLSPAQQRLPQIYLEHDPPREHPTETRHLVNDPNTLLVHVTHFNALMWDSGRTPTRVVEHGVMAPEGVRYSGELERGLVVVNGLARRGRRLGADIFERVRAEVPLDLVGTSSAELGGLGEIPHHELPAFEARYRFFFNPIRYTSLPLALCEAMMVGMPIVALATTEVAAVVQNGVTGFVSTNVSQLVERMRELLADRAQARQMGEEARRYARERFGIERFVREWNEIFALVTGTVPAPAAVSASRA